MPKIVEAFTRVLGGKPTLEYTLDGRKITTLETFYAEIGRALAGGQPWGENLDALNDVLRGGCGLVPEAFCLIWYHADHSQAALGYSETVRQLTQQLRDCPPTVLIKTAWALRAALRGQGPTVYDWLVTQIRAHPHIELVLLTEAETEAKEDSRLRR